MEVPGSRMSLLSGPTQRKCLSGLLKSARVKKKSPVSGVLVKDGRRLNDEESVPWRGIV